MNMKRIQLEAHKNLGDETTNDDILRAAGVRRIHSGWYTVLYSGVALDRFTVCGWKYNRGGEIVVENQEN